MCRVSVIIPAFNARAYIAECLESVLAQTLRDIEIICVNDGSTDGTGPMLHAYAARDPRVKVIDQENGGYGRAINAGLAAARGEYVGIVEADDYVAPQMYARLWRAAHRRGLDFVKGDYAYFSGTAGARKFDRVRVCPFYSWYFRRFDPHRTPKLLDGDMMNVTGIYRREFLLARGIRLRETPGAAFQDTGLWIQLFTQAESAMFLPGALYYIRRDNPGSSVMQPEKFDRICEEYEAASARLTPDQRRLFDPWLFRRRVFAYQFILSKARDGQRGAFIEKFSREVRAAQSSGAYDPALFTAAMDRFLRALAAWQPGAPLPRYERSASPLTRLADCVREHGTTYLVRRVLIRLGLHPEVF